MCVGQCVCVCVGVCGCKCVCVGVSVCMCVGGWMDGSVGVERCCVWVRRGPLVFEEWCIGCALNGICVWVCLCMCVGMCVFVWLCVCVSVTCDCSWSCVKMIGRCEGQGVRV